MKDAPPRVRFAPSPTGDLHVGNARTALFNWLFARRYGGVLVLRIEDTDRVRTSRAFEEHLLADLAWLGIDWDEGPGRGGPRGPYHQSERIPLYRDCLDRLIAAGLVYPCFCTDEELEAERLSLLSRKLAPRYTGKCRMLDEGERLRMAESGRPAAWRFHVPPGSIAFRDMIRGDMRFAGEALGDFIIVRSNGIPAYNFAVVVDDHLMGITHVIRGEDHLSNTALQLLLYRTLGFEPPQFAHHALILGRDRAKLGKRHGATAVREFREQGVLPEALVNYLALLGSSFEAGREFSPLEETVASFSLYRAGKSGAVFDEDKLKWLNSLYIRQEAPKILARRLLPFVARAGYGDIDGSRLHGIIEAVRDNLHDLTEIGDYLRIFDDGAYDLSPEARAIVSSPEAREVIVSLLDLIAGPVADVQDDGGPEAQSCDDAASATGPGENAGSAADSDDEVTPNLYRTLVELLAGRTGRRGKKLFLPLRAALTGRTKGPELDRCFAVLGLESIRRRLERALAV